MVFRNFLAWGGILKSTKHSGWNSYLLKRCECIWHAQKIFTATNKLGVLRVFCCFASHGFVSDHGHVMSGWRMMLLGSIALVGVGRKTNTFCHGPIFSQMLLSWRVFIVFGVHHPKIGTIFLSEKGGSRGWVFFFFTPWVGFDIPKRTQPRP